MTWLDRILTSLSIIVGSISIAPTLGFSVPRVQLELFFGSIILFLFAFLLRRLKRQHTIIISDKPKIPKNFTAQLGNPEKNGFLDQAKRLEKIQPGQNPYFYGPSLSGNSPMFYGRQNELHSTLSVLRHPDKPGNVSILGN